MTTLFNWLSHGRQNDDKALLQCLQPCHKDKVLACKHQCTKAITTLWTEFLWAFPESYTANDSWIVRSSNGGQWRDKMAQYHDQGEFLHNSYTFVSLHDSNHDGVVRIFVALFCKLWGYLFTLCGTTFPYQECNVWCNFITWNNFFLLPGV